MTILKYSNCDKKKWLWQLYLLQLKNLNCDYSKTRFDKSQILLVKISNTPIVTTLILTTQIQIVTSEIVTMQIVTTQIVTT